MHRPGKQHGNADALSRLPFHSAVGEDHLGRAEWEPNVKPTEGGAGSVWEVPDKLAGPQAPSTYVRVLHGVVE